MLVHIVRRLLSAIPLVFGVLVLTFLLVELAPGDACDAIIPPETHAETRAVLRAQWGCDDPMAVRFATEMGNLLTFDFGISGYEHRPVIDLIADALPNTLVLSLVTIVFAQLVGISVGVIQAVRQFRLTDSLLSIVTLTFYSMPSFWFAIVLLLVFTLWWPILPSSGMTGSMYDYMPPGEQIVDRLKHLVLPGVAMGVATAAGDARYVRSSMIEVIRQDFIRTARAKGLPERTVILKHALRNALLPTVTLLGLNLPYLFGGSVLVERVFGWPGMGRLIFTAIGVQDTPVLMACFFVYALLVVAGALVSDVLYAIVDPRIRYA
jgi:peptide/nickel transport system permease protein